MGAVAAVEDVVLPPPRRLVEAPEAPEAGAVDAAPLRRELRRDAPVVAEATGAAGADAGVVVDPGAAIDAEAVVDPGAVVDVDPGIEGSGGDTTEVTAVAESAGAVTAVDAAEGTVGTKTITDDPTGR